MRAVKIKYAVCLLTGAAFFYSCQQPSETKLATAYLNLPQAPYNYNSGAANDYVPTLGRVLFYDSRISANNSVSCASCHKQALAFSDNVALSTGFTGQLTSRNSLPIQNLQSDATPQLFFTGNADSTLVSTSSLFWDGRETLVDAMVLRPITNHVEMGITVDELTAKLSQLPEYRPLFEAAFGSDEVTEGKIGVALGRFISSINSSQTKFDASQGGGVQLSPAEENGRQLFLNKYNCNTCHHVIPGDFNIYQFNNFIDIGLDQTPKDQGRAGVTNNAADVGKFKIPNLRNVALTAPYMHDGRFATLSDVIDHYSVNIANSPNLDTLLKKYGAPRQMLISETEKQAIISFLNTLTDYPMITDPKFSSPFNLK